MPKVKPLTESERKDKTIKAQLIGLMKVEKIAPAEMAETLGISLNTFYRHRNEPERMTLREIRIIQNKFPGMKIE